MRNSKMLLMLTAIIIFSSSCGNDEAHVHESTDSQTNSDSSNQAAANDRVALKDDKLNAIYQHYIHLTTALVNADAGEAKLAANAIEAGSREIPGAESISASSSKIVMAKDIEAQRVEYSTLSNQMIELVKKSGVESGEVYVDYCPMAMNDKGAYWLSTRKDIRNPYFGDKMLTCGEVKETIK